MKTALPSHLKGAPSELAASAEALLGVAFPYFLPSSSLPASPSPRVKDKPEGGRGAASRPKGRRSSSTLAAAPRDKSPEAERYQSAG